MTSKIKYGNKHFNGTNGELEGKLLDLRLQIAFYSTADASA